MQNTLTKQDYIDALLEYANSDDVFADLDSLTIDELTALWDSQVQNGAVPSHNRVEI